MITAVARLMVMCLGIHHTEEAFVDGSCSSCGDMTISELHNRLLDVKHGGVPLPLPKFGIRPGTRGEKNKKNKAEVI